MLIRLASKQIRTDFPSRTTRNIMLIYARCDSCNTPSFNIAWICSRNWFHSANVTGLELALCGMLPAMLNSYSNCVHFPGRFVNCCRYLDSTLHKASCCAVDSRYFRHTLARSCSSEIVLSSVIRLLVLASCGEVTSSLFGQVVPKPTEVLSVASLVFPTLSLSKSTLSVTRSPTFFELANAAKYSRQNVQTFPYFAAMSLFSAQFFSLCWIKVS